jgi:hypothetical protein
LKNQADSTKNEQAKNHVATLSHVVCLQQHQSSSSSSGRVSQGNNPLDSSINEITDSRLRRAHVILQFAQSPFRYKRHTISKNCVC